MRKEICGFSESVGNHLSGGWVSSCSCQRCFDSQLRAEPGDCLIVLAHGLLQLGELGGDGVEIDLHLLVEGIDVAGDVEVELVFLHLAEVGHVAELFLAAALPVGGDDALDVLGAEVVLIPHLFKALAGIDEQDVVRVLAAFFQHEDAGGNAGAVKDVRWQADDGVEVVAGVDEVAADVLLGPATEQHAMRQYAGHGGPVIQVVDHVLHKGEVRLR